MVTANVAGRLIQLKLCWDTVVPSSVGWDWVQILTRDYNIDRSEVKILCPYSNSRAPGDMCHLRYGTERRRYQACPICLSIEIIPKL